MTTITKVALAGASGNLGAPVLQQLLAASFKVTVLTRNGSSHSFPSSVTVKNVDYDSQDSLVSALQGQDAVVSTLASLALKTQLSLIQAAAKANVKRFIPSEFGSNTLNPKTSQIPVFGDKIAVQEALKKEAAAGGLSYTIIANGPFLDWGLKFGLFLNAKDKSIVLYDGGERKFSATTLSDIGKAVVGVLRHPEETENRAVFVHSATLTLKQLQELGEKSTGTKWQSTVVSTEDELSQGWAELKKESPNGEKLFLHFLRPAIWGEGYGSYFDTTDNELLGIKELSASEIQALVDAATK